ncbi:MAG: GTPase [Bacteroidetes bacterium]|nr:GTPase [Bacteroidota bacterium]
MERRKVLIIGAAGRDFHNFNVYFRNNEQYEVVAFTAAQIPDIAGRAYPAALSGDLYPNGIPILPEEDMPELIVNHDIRECFFSYSDVSYSKVMQIGAIVQAAGATYTLLGPDDTMIPSNKPVIAVCAVRTGCGKSPASRKILEILQEKGLRAVVIRHPMPYGNLEKQKVQRFAHLRDFEEQACTIEEMEEYEPYVARGNVIYAGADYGAIIDAAEKDILGCDVVLWDGGNNDFSFYKPDLQITIVDPHRPGDELSYYPGEVNLRRSDVVIINKVDSAEKHNIETVRRNVGKVAPNAIVMEAALDIKTDDPAVVTGKRVLVIEDGPTLTHGGMKTGAGTIAAQRHNAAELVDPRPFLVGKLKETFEEYPGIGKLLPAMGYGKEQLSDLESTINNTVCDAVVIGTPIDLGRLVDIKHPNTRVYYELEEKSGPSLADILNEFISDHNLK